MQKSSKANNKLMLATRHNMETTSCRYPIARCSVCGSENSATSRDYWMLEKDIPLQCCGQSMFLVKKVTEYLYLLEDDVQKEGHGRGY